MRELPIRECQSVGGGMWGSERPFLLDAAATRLPRTNSYGEKLPEIIQSVCQTVNFGPVQKTTCINSDDTETVTTCLDASVRVSAGPISLGGGVGICESITVQIKR